MAATLEDITITDIIMGVTLVMDMEDTADTAATVVSVHHLLADSSAG